MTHPFTPKGFAGLAIGLTLVAIHLVGINITGTSVSPARSIGPAVVGVASNPHALLQLWLFIIAPLIGAARRAYSSAKGALDASFKQRVEVKRIRRSQRNDRDGGQRKVCDFLYGKLDGS